MRILSQYSELFNYNVLTLLAYRVSASAAAPSYDSVDATAGPPPSYDSLFKRIKVAKQESTSNVGFIRALPGIFSGVATFRK